MRPSKLILLSCFSSFMASSLACTSSQAMPAAQVKTFRSWMALIAEDQITRGANPRWSHRDCAGLVRFAVREALVKHDDAWRKNNGFTGRPLPAELEISTEERAQLAEWKNSETERGAFVRALPLVQQNTEPLGRTPDVALEPGDLLFFDQGDDQHVMMWTGRRVVYHNGQRPKPGQKLKDNGLRAVTLPELLRWNDSRWQPRPENPNFVGFYRLAFLGSSK